MSERRGTLERYTRILEMLAVARSGMSLNDVIAATRLPRGTVHRLVNALVRVDLVAVQSGRSKTYVLGSRLKRMLYSGLPPDLVTALARPFLEEFAIEFGETALLARLNGSQVEKVAAWVPGNGKYSYIQPSRLMPIHATASAKAIFAFQEDTLIDEALRPKLVRYTRNTKVSKTGIRAEFAQVRKDGFAMCSDEFDPGVLSYACPVHITGFGTPYSIGIVGLRERLRRHPTKDIVQGLVKRANALALALYGHATGADGEQSPLRLSGGKKSRTKKARPTAPKAETSPRAARPASVRRNGHGTARARSRVPASRASSLAVGHGVRP